MVIRRVRPAADAVEALATAGTSTLAAVPASIDRRDTRMWIPPGLSETHGAEVLEPDLGGVQRIGGLVVLDDVLGDVVAGSREDAREVDDAGTRVGHLPVRGHVLDVVLRHAREVPPEQLDRVRAAGHRPEQ